MTDASRRLHAVLGAALAAAFAAVGLLFVVIPGGVLRFFDALSRRAGFAPFPGPLERFWLVLAAAYMYVVTVLAWFMFRRPEDPAYPRLLAHAKLASAAQAKRRVRARVEADVAELVVVEHDLPLRPVAPGGLNITR